MGCLHVTQLLPPFPDLPWGRRALGVPLIVLGAILAAASHREWGRDQSALRHGRPLPRTILPRILASVITADALLAAILVVTAGGPGR